MSELQNAESVTSDVDMSVAVDPAQLNRPVHPSATEDSLELVRHKLSLANQHAKQFKREREETQRQLDELNAKYLQLQDAQQAAAKQTLEDQGKYKELWEKERADRKALQATHLTENARLKAELESVTEERSQERLKNAAMAAIRAANAVNTDQMFTLLQSGLRTDDEG